MKRNITLRVLAALSALLMTASFAACAGGGESTETTAPGAETTLPVETQPAETQPAVDENGFLLDNLPADLDFGGEKINVYYWDTEFLRNELTADGSTADIVDVAVYQRNLSVEERLNIDMNYIAGDVAAEYFMPAVRDIIMSGSTELDVIVSPY